MIDRVKATHEEVIEADPPHHIVDLSHPLRDEADGAVDSGSKELTFRQTNPDCFQQDRNLPNANCRVVREALSPQLSGDFFLSCAHRRGVKQLVQTFENSHHAMAVALTGAQFHRISALIAEIPSRRSLCCELRY